MRDIFVNDLPSDCGLWIGDLTTKQVSQLTSNPGCEREELPRWSPDGLRIADIRPSYTEMPPAAGAVIPSASTARSPNGEWLVFSTYPLNDFQCCQVSNVYRIHPDGSGQEQLTNFDDASVRATQPSYSSDGKWIAFTRATTDTAHELPIMPAGGGDTFTVDGPPGRYTHGAWQPVP